jgi:hypothetical protein
MKPQIANCYQLIATHFSIHMLSHFKPFLRAR